MLESQIRPADSRDFPAVGELVSGRRELFRVFANGNGPLTWLANALS